MTRNLTTRKREAGQALIAAVAGLGIVLMGFAGLGIDIGYMRYQKRLEQTAADSAAIAGAAELPFSTSGYTAAAQHDAASNGFTNGANNVTVTVNSPPTSGPHNAAAGYVEVTVAKVQPTFFMSILGINNRTVTARAVASGNANSSGCIYLLGPSGNDLTITGAGVGLSMPNCGIIDNSGLDITGAGDSIDAQSIGVHGSYTHTGSGISVNPTPVTGIVAASDPLSYLTPPAGGTVRANPNIMGAGVVTTLLPGNYTAGITIIGAGDNVTFSPGAYTIGGNFNVTGSSITLTGNGVTFYQTGGAISMTGAGLNANLSAPNSGTDAGILFWQASSDGNAASFTGAGISTKVQGAFYFPGAGITMTGAGSSALYTFIVAQSLTLTGAGITLPINNNTSGVTGGSPIKTALLVE